MPSHVTCADMLFTFYCKGFFQWSPLFFFSHFLSIFAAPLLLTSPSHLLYLLFPPFISPLLISPLLSTFSGSYLPYSFLPFIDLLPPSSFLTFIFLSPLISSPLIPSCTHALTLKVPILSSSLLTYLSVCLTFTSHFVPSPTSVFIPSFPPSFPHFTPSISPSFPSLYFTPLISPFFLITPLTPGFDPKGPLWPRPAVVCTLNWLLRLPHHIHTNRCVCVYVCACVVWCGVVWCDVMWCDVMWYGVMWCDVMWCGVVWCCMMSCHVVSFCAILFYSVLFSSSSCDDMWCIVV